MWHLTLLDDAAIGIENADLMHFGAPIDTDEKVIGDFRQWNLLQVEFGLPQSTSPLYWRSLARTPHGTFDCGRTERALLRTRHLKNVRGKGMALLPDRPTQSGLPHLEATLKGTGERGAALVPASAHRNPEREQRSAQSQRFENSNIGLTLHVD